jgi:hypothetical protein
LWVHFPSSWRTSFSSFFSEWESLSGKFSQSLNRNVFLLFSLEYI